MIEDDMLQAEAKRLGMTVTQLKMLRAVPPDVMRDVVRDARRSNSPSSMIVEKDRPAPTVRGTGWVEPLPIEQPPGIAILDRIMDAQDAKDRREAERRR